MFSVDIWGNVASWVGAVSTGGAALAALGYYVLDSRKARAAQARLVRANLHPEQDGVFEITVTNDSDRPISLELLFWWGKDFDKAVLTGQPMEIRTGIQDGTDQHGQPLIRTGAIQNAYRHVESKQELLGYAGGGGTANVRFMLGDDKSRLMPGKSQRFLVERVLYEIGMEYRLYFFDANGLAWELELLPAPSSPGKLRRSRYRRSSNRLSASTRSRLKPIGHLRIAKQRIGTQLERRVWLHNHRRQKTTPYPGLTAESWECLMLARSERSKASEASTQDPRDRPDTVSNGPSHN